MKTKTFLFILSVILGSLAFADLDGVSLPEFGLSFHEQISPSYSSNASGTYTQYDNGRSVWWSPTPPNYIYISLSAVVTGYGEVYGGFDYDVGGVTGSASTVGKAGSFGIRMVSFGIWKPYATREENATITLSSQDGVWYPPEFGTIDWSSTNGWITLVGQKWTAEAPAVGQPVGKWEPLEKSNDKTNLSGNGETTKSLSYVCSIASCGQTGLRSPTAHYVNPCPNAGCQQGGWYWICNGVPSRHALLATCSNCNASSVYACSGHPDNCTSSGSTPPSNPPSPPTDNTPNCQDCTSDCSSPCSCTNSGTCGGTVSTPPTPTLVTCGAANWTGCSGAESRMKHYVPLCTKGCGNDYWTCSQWAYRHEDEQTCRRPGCGATFYFCNNGPCTSDWGNSPSHWAR